jgi:nucleotide-binding universal stress UspA family protein
MNARRVVVGVDSSFSARLALQHAARRTGSDGELLVAYVLSPLPSAAVGSLQDLDRDRRTDAQERVELLASDVSARTESILLDGNPAERLAALARERDADEIVVGSRGLGRFSAALGSVSHALISQADHPVVVVPSASADHPRVPRPDGACMVVVGYDGSDPSRSALAYAARRAADGHVVAVHAFHPVPDWLGSPNYGRALDAYQAHGRELLQALEQERGYGATLETSLVEGPPARAIVAVADARDADEIVIGSRGFGAMRGVLGSVSHAVLHEADRVVVVIPADAVHDPE